MFITKETALRGVLCKEYYSAIEKFFETCQKKKVTEKNLIQLAKIVKKERPNNSLDEIMSAILYHFIRHTLMYTGKSHYFNLGYPFSSHSMVNKIPAGKLWTEFIKICKKYRIGDYYVKKRSSSLLYKELGSSL